MKHIRKNSIVFCGGAYGDEGKGRIVDEYVALYAKKYRVVVYRDNGGANAGHTIEIGDVRLSLHQLPSGVLHKKVKVILGKGMVIHPGDLAVELDVVTRTVGSLPATVIIDEETPLCLDTHRAFEAALKSWQDGSKGATGRGIAPAYADILLRHPLRMRDLIAFHTDKLQKHYRLYEALVRGLGGDLSQALVPTLNGGTQQVGDIEFFIDTLKRHRTALLPYVANVHDMLKRLWHDKKTAFVFEKAQGLGHDVRFGVYPDITASDTTPDGIYGATEGIIDPDTIKDRIGVIKATYMSSVGIRKLPTVMDETLANAIRHDAHEYGATTKRPRDVVHIDIPSLAYFARVGRLTGLALTHMDIVYPHTPIAVCTSYTKQGKTVDYRPDQEYLNDITPNYIYFAPWDKEKLMQAKRYGQLPKEAKTYIAFLKKAIGVPVLLITTGPKRSQTIMVRG